MDPKNESTLPLNLNIILSGYIPDGCSQNQIMEQVHQVIRNITTVAAKYNKPRFGYSGGTININILSSPSIADSFALNVVHQNKNRLFCAIPYAVERMKEENQIIPEFVAAADSVTQLDMDYRFPIMAKSRIMKWLLDQSDLAIVLWDGHEDSFNGDQWTMLQIAREKEMPCIWIDINHPGNTYWTKKG